MPSRSKSSTVLTGSNWRPVNFSEELPSDSAPTGSLFAAYGGKPTIANSKIILSPLITHKPSNKSVDMDTDNSVSSRSHRSGLSAENHIPKKIGISLNAEQLSNRTENKPSTEHMSQEMPKKTSCNEVSKDKQTLIQEKKACIEEVGLF